MADLLAKPTTMDENKLEGAEKKMELPTIPPNKSPEKLNSEESSNLRNEKSNVSLLSSMELTKQKMDFLNSMKETMKVNKAIKKKSNARNQERKNLFLPPMDASDVPLHKDIVWYYEAQNKLDIEDTYDDIHHKMDSVDTNVEKALKKNQGIFLDWYYGKWYNLQRKIKLLEEDANISSINKKIARDMISLKAQLQSFRDEAQKLETLCKTNSRKLINLRRMNSRAEDENQFVHDQIQYATTNNDVLVRRINTTEKEIQDIDKGNTSRMEYNMEEESGRIKEFTNLEITQNKELNEESAIEPNISQFIPTTHADYEADSVVIKYQNKIKYLTRKFAGIKKLNAMPGKRPYLIREINGYEQKFIDSIKIVNARLIRRKNKSASHSHSMSKLLSKSQPNIKLKQEHSMEISVGANHNISLNQFTETDKLQTISAFLMNESVLRYIYEKMFPGCT